MIHWGLAHFLVDGHHKLEAAAAIGARLRVLSLVSVNDSLAERADLERLPTILGAGEDQVSDSAASVSVNSSASSPPDARSAIERTLWQHGHQGDSCAIVATQVLRALSDAGLEIVPVEPHDGDDQRTPFPPA